VVRWLAVLSAVLVLSGCGQRAKPELVACYAGDRDFHLCGYPEDPRLVSRILSSDHTVVTGPLEGSVEDQRGYWRSVHLSPDRRTLLVTWSGECESQTALFVATSGGRPSVVTGEDDWHKAPESIGLGWTRDGKARVRLPKGACGRTPHRPGVYLIDPGTGAITGPAG
jgi:hypothetical protein